MKGPVELRFEKEVPEEAKNNPFYWSPYEISEVGFDDRVIEVFSTESEEYVDRWLGYMQRDHRKRRGALVAGLAAFRGSPEWSWRTKTGAVTRPIRAFAICLGGSHALVYQPRHNLRPPCAIFSRALRDLLEDRRVSVVAHDARRLAAEIEREYGVRVAKPVGMRVPVAAVHGKERVFEWRKKGPRLVMVGADREQMVEMVLGGRRVEKMPTRVAQDDWGYELSDDQLLHATVDAFLCFEMGVKCLKMIGRPT